MCDFPSEESSKREAWFGCIDTVTHSNLTVRESAPERLKISVHLELIQTYTHAEGGGVTNRG